MTIDRGKTREASNKTEFDTRALTTGKARSPVVSLCEGGTTSSDMDAERSRCLGPLSPQITCER